MHFDNSLLGRGTTWLRGVAGTVGLLTAMLATSASAAPVLSVNHASSGSGTVTVAVNAEQVEDLFTYQFSLTYDPSVLSAQTVTEGSFLGLGGTTFFDGGTIDNSTGRVSLVLGSLVGPTAGVDGSGTLASIAFNVLRPTTTSLSLTDAWLLDSAINDIAFTVRGVALPVPEPESWTMMALGLAVVAAIRRRSGAAAAS